MLGHTQPKPINISAQCLFYKCKIYTVHTCSSVMPLLSAPAGTLLSLMADFGVGRFVLSGVSGQLQQLHC